MELRAIHVFFSGRVQGVGFRYTVREAAVRVGVTGWVRNRRDGRVELWAQGSEDQLKQLLDAILTGPLGPNVEHLERDEVEPESLTGFEVRPTF